MTRTRIAYMPIATYPEAVADASVAAAADLAVALGCALQVTTFAVDIPRVSSALGSLLLDVPALVRSAEDRSRSECQRLHDLLGSRTGVQCTIREAVLGAALETAAAEARYFDLAVLPWSGETVAAQDMTQAVVFGSGRPALLVPPAAPPASLDHLAIAWDASRVAARALGDALPLLAEGGRITVLTVEDEKPLSGSDLAGALAASLARRGYSARPLGVSLAGRTIAAALQDTALAEGAQVLAMGGFGHSRLRDFIVGGATRGVFAELHLPVLLAH